MSVEREVLQRFGERIATGLERRPLRIGAEEHGEKLRDLLARAGSENHFEILGLSVVADDDAVVVAYEALARLAHPCHADVLGPRSSAALEILFARLTEAYLSLSDRQRRREYLAWLDLPARATEGEAKELEHRKREVVALAREQYRNAHSLAARADYFPAIALLEQAVALDPRSEYLALLARCQAQNPRWLARAQASLARACELEPGNADLLCELAEIHERAGDREEARIALERALAASPGLSRARERLERLGGARTLRFKRRQALE